MSGRSAEQKNNTVLERIIGVENLPFLSLVDHETLVQLQVHINGYTQNYDGKMIIAKYDKCDV